MSARPDVPGRVLSGFFFLKTIGMALSQIWANKTRSFLTALGIIVGVASVTAVIAALTGLKTKVLTEFESVGAARLYVFPNRPDNVPRSKIPWEKCRLRVEEARAIGEQCPSLKGISPIVDVTLSVESDTSLIEGMTVSGIWPAWHDAIGRKVLRGRPFSQIDVDTARQVALVNEAAVEELKLDEGGNGGIGTHVLLGGRRFMVIGVVETLQAKMFGMNSSQAEIFVPFSVAEKLLEGWYFMQFVAIAKSPEVAEEAKAEIEYVMRRQRGLTKEDPDTFRVAAIDQFINQFKSLASGVTAIAGGIVGISLLVGGIGIMNIMLVSVSERTREIGLRKAVGATSAAILLQFLLEAVTLTVLGGLVGLVIGKIFAISLTFIPGANLEQADVPAWAIAVALVFSAGVGVLFGMWPAYKASRLDPIEALRHE
ncbi:MAG: Macrolide export ATP-binding/permease protein MacB [Planctomycetota bacterium]|jgi:putative ABC transport system permease protein